MIDFLTIDLSLENATIALKYRAKMSEQWLHILGNLTFNLSHPFSELLTDFTNLLTKCVSAICFLSI